MRTPPLRLLALAALGLPLLGQDDIQDQFRRGVSYYKQGQYARAIQEFEQIVRVDPEYETGFRILGDCHLKLQQYDRAIQVFQQALRLKDDQYYSFYGLALAYYNSGNYPDAIATLLRGERYAQSPRDRYELYHIRGSAYFNSGQFEQAAADLKQAISIQRGNLDDVLQLGISSYHLGQEGDAEIYLKQALALDPELIQAQRYLSRLQYREAVQAIEEKDYRSAARLLRTYLSQQPEDGEAWFNLGLAELFAEQLPAAEKAFVRSTELMPENWESHQRLGYIYEQQRAYQQALRHYQTANDLHPDPRLRESLERIRERIRRQQEEQG